MSINIGIQLDHLNILNPKTDTSLLLGCEAQRRGHRVMFYHPSDLSLLNGEVMVNAGTLKIDNTSEGNIGTAGEKSNINLKTFDVVLIRQNPPFDMAYVTSTYLLEQVSNQVLVLNHPRGIRNAAEKLLPLQFKELIPPTLISSDWEMISEFRHEWGDIIIKPLYDYGGHSVFKSSRNDGQLKALLQLLRRGYPNLPFIIQPFLEQIIKGDRRVLLMDGEIVGAFSRVPAKGEIRSNTLMGGSFKSCELTKRDLEICNGVKSTLQDMGLFLVGLDIIDRYLIEINVTSPTGLVLLNSLTDFKSEVVFWDKVEKIISNKGKDGSKYYNSCISGS